MNIKNHVTTVLLGPILFMAITLYSQSSSAGMRGMMRMMDNTPPTVTGTGLNNALGVGANPNVSATFSEDMDPDTINEATFMLADPLGNGVVGGVSYEDATDTATFAPLNGLFFGVTYSGTITTGVQDLAGNALVSDYVWNMATSAAPVTGGEWHSTALLSNGTVWSWGGGSQGQLGNGILGPGTSSFAPVQVVDPTDSTGFLTGVLTVNTGGRHALALKSDGTVWAWGNNDVGQLGNNDRPNDSPAPVLVCDNGEAVPCTAGLSDVTTLAIGWYHTLAIKSDGSVWSWGGNSQGQLGNGSTTASSTPVQVVDPADGAGSLTGVVAIATGFTHSFALKSDGTVWAWGNNDFGQLGNNDRPNDSTIPVQVVGLTGMVAIASGGWHSFALKSDGSVWSWGGNSQGQLGNGSRTVSSTPIQVLNEDGTGTLTGIVSLGGGGLRQHSLALKSDGSVWAWGYNNVGQLGNGTTANRSTTPVQVLNEDGTGTLTGIVSLGGGQYHSLALQSDGTVWAWGGNSIGQLGTGTASAGGIPTPVRVNPFN